MISGHNIGKLEIKIRKIFENSPKFLEIKNMLLNNPKIKEDIT